MNKEEDKIKIEVTSEPTLCQKNCGFYGNPKNGGLCSSCYQKDLKSNNSGGIGSSLMNSNNSINNNSNSQKIVSESISIPSSSSGGIGSVVTGGTSSSPVPIKGGGLKRNNIDYGNMLDYADEILKTSPRPGSYLGSNMNISKSLGSHNGSKDFEMGSSLPKTTGSIPIPIPGGINSNSLGVSPSTPPTGGSFQFTPGTTPTTPMGSPSNAVRCKFQDCNKPIGGIMATANKCRCGENYCGKHIHNHNCTFDYKAMAKNTIAKNNPQVLGNKIVKL